MNSHTLPRISCKALSPISKHLSHSLCNISFLSQAILCFLHLLKCLIFSIQRVTVSFIVNESTADFNHLTADHARHFQEFQPLVTKLPPATASMSSNGTSGCLQQPLMAIQVTIFPNIGISIGVAFCLVAADGKKLAHFMKSWASVHSSQGDLTCLNNSLPNFNRDLIKDPLELASLFMKEKCEYGDLSSIPIHKFRITSDIKRSQIDLLKDWVKRKCMEADRGRIYD